MSNQPIQLDDLLIDTDKQLVSRAEQVISLPKLSYQLLLFFIHHPHKTHSVDEIANAVWSNREVSNETVIQRVRLLRQSLADNPQSPRYIKSVRGFGYQLISSPKTLDPTNSNMQAPQTVQHDASAQSRSIRIQVSILFAIILVIGSLVSFKMLVTQNSDKSSPYSETKKPSTSDSMPHSAGNSALNSSQSNSSSILARADYYFRIGQQDDLRRAETFYRKALLEPEQKIRASIGLANTLSALVCRYSQPRKLAEESDKLMQQLLADPSLNQITRADAWTAKGYAVDCLGNLELALQSYIKAVELNPNDFSSRSSAAHLLEKSGQHIKAIEWNLQVLKQAGESPLTQLQLARNLELLGFVSQARKIYQNGFELYPDNVFINEAYPQFLFSQGELAKANQVALQAVERGIFRRDIYRLLGEIALRQQDRPKAIAWFEQSKSINPNASYNHTIQEIYTGSLTKKQAEQRVETINQAISSGDTWPDNFLELYAIQLNILEHQSKALNSLNRLANHGFLDLGYLQNSPFFDPVRSNDSFIQLLDQLTQKRQALKQQLIQQSWISNQWLED